MLRQSVFRLNSLGIRCRQFSTTAAAQLDQIETKYIINQASVKINLPNKGFTWFFISQDSTVQQFLDETKVEDSSIAEIQVLQGDKKVQTESDSKMYSLIDDKSLPLFLKINNIYYQFENAHTAKDSGIEALQIKTQNKWADQAKDWQPIHRTTVATIAKQLQDNIEFTKPDQAGKQAKGKKAAEEYVTLDQVKAEFVKQARFFENPIVHSETFNLYTQRLIFQSEIDKLTERKEQIHAKEDRRGQMKIAAITAFFTIQFGASCYAIFYVPWLGWDLVEPVTYSLTQGSFILGLLYAMRHRGMSVEFTGLTEYWQMEQQRKWMKKHQFDLNRYHFLQEQLKKIDQEIKAVEQQRFQ